MNINFEYYKVFYIISRNKNITKAAEELCISQPAISRMLKTMEGQMNVKLFVRKNKGVILTPEGQELYRLLSKNISNIIEAEIEFSKYIRNDNIKIAIDSNYLNYLIKSKKFENILNNKNNITFFNTDNFDLLNEQLKNNLIDFAFIIDDENYKFNDDVILKQFEKLSMIFVSNDQDTKKPIAILNNGKNKKVLDKFLNSLDIKNLSVINVNNYSNIYNLVINGYSNGFLFKEFIEEDLENKKLTNISKNQNFYFINVALLYNKNNEGKIEKLLHL